MKVKEIISATQWLPSRRYDHDKPLISVLLPTFRRGASGLFLKAARSVLNQSLSELELIIVDDASTDGTADQIQELIAGDDRVSCLRHPENVGLPAISEYEALMRARAAYLAFAFDDDEFYPHALQKLFDYALKNNSSIIHGHVDMHFFDKVTEKRLKISGFGRGDMPQSSLAGANYLSNNAVLLHRRVVEKIGFYDPHIAISRLCDWDLWRRISRCFDLVAVDVPVGRVLGPSTGDSLGHTYQMEPWQAIEWMNLPRNEQLLPENFGEYDVLEIPDTLSRQTRLAIEEIRENFKEKFWFSKQLKKHYFSIRPDSLEESPIENARILVVTSTHDASTSLYFDYLPHFYNQRIRIINSIQWHPEEMIGASAVIFIRHLLYFKEWVEYARKLKIPHYYFVDDNLILLRQEPAFKNDYLFFTNENVRKFLESFSGVLLSTYHLLDYFKENRLHENLIYYPPVAGHPVLYEPTGSDPKKNRGLRLAYFGGGHRLQPFKELVLPAVYEFSKHHPVELFIGGMSDNSFPSSENLNIYYFPYEVSYHLSLGRFAAKEIDVLLHPNSRTINNPYKTLNVLINAMAMNAIPVLSDEPPYDLLGPEKVALLSGQNRDSWLEAVQTVYEESSIVKGIRENLKQFCQKHYSGEANVAALDKILRTCPHPGLILRDSRYRTYVESVRHQVRRQEEYQIDEGSDSFSIVSPLGQPNSHIRISKRIQYQLIPKRNQWAGLEVLVGTHHRQAQGKIHLRIWAKSGVLLREIAVHLEKVRDNDWLKFRFPPIEESASISFNLEFRLTDPGPETMISFFENNHFENRSSRLFRRLGFIHQGNDLYCRIWYQS
jgi:glycosyltransferase involved in cell wall biosynthesis